MTDLARTVGLSQSSLYYWFRSKEDVLRGLTQANRESLDIAEQLAAAGAPAATRLYAVLYTDVLQMCRGSLDFYDLERVASAQPEWFSELLEDYGRLGSAIEEILRTGARSGEFDIEDPRIATVSCLAQTEGMQHRFRSPTPGAAPLADATTAARLAARGVLRATLADPSRTDAAEQSALELIAAHAED